MNISPLRRSLLALSVAAATATAHALPVSDLTYDMGSGALDVPGVTYNNVTLNGTSQNAGADFKSVDIQGTFINNAAINLDSSTSADGLNFTPHLTGSTRIGGDLINRGNITMNGLSPNAFPAAITVNLGTLVGGNLINEGNLVVTGNGAMGMDLYKANIVGEVSNRGAINVTGDHADGMLVTTNLLRIDNAGTITARGNEADGIHVEKAHFSDLMASNTKGNVNNTGTISADGVGIHLVSLDNPGSHFSITQSAGLLEGGKAAILADANANPSFFYWKGGDVKGDLLGLSGVLVQGDVEYDGSTIRAGYVDVGDARLTLLRPQTTIIGNLDLDDSTSRLRLLLDNDTKLNAPILKVTGNTFFSAGSRIELQARSDDFRTSAQGNRYTLINSGTWEDEQNLSVVSSSALLEVKNFGIEGQDVKALVATRSDDVIEQNLLGASASRNAVNAIQPFKNTVMGQLGESDRVFQAFANTSSDAELAKLAETLAPDVSRGVINAATSSQTLVSNAITHRSSNARNGLSSGEGLADTGVWLQALSSDADQDRRHGIEGYDANTNGIAVGADGKLDADTTVGLAYSYLTSDVKTDRGNKTDVSGHALTLYGNWTHDNFFVDASVMYGWNDNESKRYIAGSRAKADYDSEIFGVNALAGYTFQLDKQLVLEPQIGARYANVSMDAYREKGSSAALNVGSQRYEIGEMGLGARLAAAFDVGVGSLEPEAKLMAWHDFIGDKAGTTSTFVLGGTPFTTRGATPARDSYELGLGATYRVGAWSVGGSYNYLTSSGFDADTFTANVRYDF